MRSPLNTLPQEIQSSLVSMRHRRTLDCWYVGDISVRFTDDAMEKSKQVTVTEIRNEIGYFAGLSERTVRYYERLSRFFPSGHCADCATLNQDEHGNYVGGTLLIKHPTMNTALFCPNCKDVSEDIRNRYHLLAVRQFTIATKKSLQKYWLEVLEFCYKDGVPRSVDACERHFTGGLKPEHSMEVVTNPDKIATSTGFMSAFHNVVVLAKRFTTHYPMPDRYRERLMTAIDEIESISQKVFSADHTVL